MSKQYVYMLLDETSEDDNYLLGIFESLEKFQEFLATIDEPIVKDREYEELLLKQIELNKGEFAIDGDPVLRVEIEEVLINETEDARGWQITQLKRKEQKSGRWRWEVADKRRCK